MPRLVAIWSLFPDLLRRADLLAAANITSDAQPRWTFRTAEGRLITLRLAARVRSADDTAILGGAPPLWERRPNESFWMADWPGSATLYVNFRSYDGLGEQAAALAKRLDQSRAERLVIDMRDNGGGDLQLGRRLLIPEIVKRPGINRKGRLFVLIGRHTFSAAMVNAADLRRSTEAILVGEPIGENPNSWMEARQFHLPNSGLGVGVSVAFSTNAPAGVESIEPDIYAPPSWRDWSRGRDNAMDAIWREILRRSAMIGLGEK